MRRFEDKRVLVIGGANGIGAATASRFAEEGASTVIADIDRQAGESLRQTLLDRGLTAEFVATDVRDDAAVEAAVAVAAGSGGLDVAVHSAYMNTKVGILDLPRDDWDEISSVLLRSAFVMTQAAVPHLIEADDGNIVHISSVAAVKGSRVGPAYGASKAGLLGLVRYTAVEFGDRGVRCNAVLPGLVIVDRNREMWTADPTKLAAAETTIPLGRSAHPDEIAAAVAFLASSDAGYVTGAALTVDGGATIG
ncbi:MAG: SDR family NAD(P)-dependent oxidoreductase [Acidimicrobiia bacterium]|nr:SDR family NAD(P)-dependent oxidoreductase [Acidimicrobiia bacterium]